LEGRRKGEGEDIRIRRSMFDLESSSSFLSSAQRKACPLHIEFIFLNQKHVNPVVEKIEGRGQSFSLEELCNLF
jgi:hypothetical protein